MPGIGVGNGLWRNAGTKPAAIVLGALSQITLLPSSVSLSPDTTTATVTGTPRDAAGHVRADVVTYHSSNTAVATINSSGVITRVGSGTTGITAVSGAVTSNTVVVTSAAFGATTQIVMAPTTLSLSTSGTVTATPEDQFGNPTTAVVTYHSSFPNVATVNSSGVVTVLRDGTTTIAGTATGASGTITSNGCVVTASASTSTGVPAAIAITPTTFSLPSVGATQQFAATATDINSVAVTGLSFEWYSTDTRYVTIDTDSGLATRIAAGGAAKIYARYELLPAWTVRATVGPTEFAAGNTGVFSTNGTIVTPPAGIFPAGNKAVQLDYDRLDTEKEHFQDDSSFGASDGTVPFSPRQWYNVDRNVNLETARNSIICGVDDELLMTWTFAFDSDTVYLDSRGTVLLKSDYPRTGDGNLVPNIPAPFTLVGMSNEQTYMDTEYDAAVTGKAVIHTFVAGPYAPPLLTATTFSHLHRFDSDWGQANGRGQMWINGTSVINRRTVRYSDPAAEYTTPGDLMGRLYNILSVGDQISGTCPYHRREWVSSITISTRRYR